VEADLEPERDWSYVVVIRQFARERGPEMAGPPQVLRGVIRRHRIALALALAVLTWVTPAASTIARGVDPLRLWVTDGTVNSLVATPQGVFAGGDFTLVGPRTGRWATVRPDGVAPVRAAVQGEVVAAAADGRGGWYLAGETLAVGGIVRTGVIHLGANEKLDTRWNPKLNGGVSAITRVRSTLYLGGDFTKVARKTRLRLAAVDAKTGALKRWAPRVRPVKKDEGAYVSALVPAPDGKTMYVAGFFGRLGRKRRANLAAVDLRTGSVRGWHPRVDGAVEAIAAAPGGRLIYAGGEFGRAGGQPRSGLAAFELRTGAVTSWHPDCDGSISSIAVGRSGFPIYVAGSFASIGDKSRRGLAALDRRRGAATPWDPNVGGSVNTLLLAPRRHTVFIGGEFESVGDLDRSNLAAIDTRTAVAGLWNPQTIGPVNVLAPAGHGVIGTGGSFTSVGAVRRTSLALIDLDGRLSRWAPSLRGTVRALAVSPDGARVYVGGRFTLGGSQSSRSLAVIDPAALTLSPWGASLNSGVWAIAPSSDGQTVYLGGAFTTASSRTRRRLAALDAGSGALTNWTAGATGLVRQLALSGDQLWVAGEFGSVGGQQRTGVASLDVETGHATGWDAGADDNVSALAVTSDNVFVGGDFTTIGGRSRKYLAELDAGDGGATRWDPSPDDVVTALGVSPSARTLVAVGDFTKISGARRDIGEFDLATGF
jgi:hypothetical protein